MGHIEAPSATTNLQRPWIAQLLGLCGLSGNFVVNSELRVGCPEGVTAFSLIVLVEGLRFQADKSCESAGNSAEFFFRRTQKE